MTETLTSIQPAQANTVNPIVQNPPLILAVDPGTRELGFAVLKGGELLYYGVKTVTDRKSPVIILDAVSSFIKELIETYQPKFLAIEKMFVTQKNSALLTVAAEQIKAVGKELNLQVYEYAPSTVRKRLCSSGRATKRETAQVLSERYSELARYYNRTRKWEMDYYANLFDAVAVGAVCLEDLHLSDSDLNQFPAKDGSSQ